MAAGDHHAVLVAGIQQQQNSRRDAAYPTNAVQPATQPGPHVAGASVGDDCVSASAVRLSKCTAECVNVHVKPYIMVSIALGMRSPEQQPWHAPRTNNTPPRHLFLLYSVPLVALP
ncbi:hypothetical protein MTO96_043101 [Rhipicephalus appendiculatus]